MIDIVADLHLHSHYSRAVSPQMTIPVMAQFGRAKGIDVLATGDWTHPIWFRELRRQLEEAEEGIFKVKGGQDQEVRFLLSVEIACIYTQGGKGRRIHNLVFVPSFATAEKINKALVTRGFNLSSDGRPIIGMSSKHLLELVMEIDDKSLLIPAHAWTPWFGIYGQMSGFNSLSEAFEEASDKLYGIETGLSSDPEMNWQVDELQTRSILSFSDAHSPAKMGREATIFRLESLSYDNIRKAIVAPSQKVISSQLLVNGKETTVNSKPITNNVQNRVLYTIEFYPEEGKYHYSGHRKCNVTMTPEEQKKAKGICPICKRKVTDGVMRRVQELAQEEPRGMHEPTEKGPVWIRDPQHKHPPFVKIVPLLEIIAEAIHSPVGSPKAKVIFDSLTETTDEFSLLLKSPLKEIVQATTRIATPEKAQRIVEGIEKVRQAQIVIQPGYDGVYGVVKIWPSDAKAMEGKSSEDKVITQIGLEF